MLFLTHRLLLCEQTFPYEFIQVKDRPEECKDIRRALITLAGKRFQYIRISAMRLRIYSR